MAPYRDPDDRREQAEPSRVRLMAKFLRERAERETLWRQARASAEAAVAHKLARREQRERPFLPLAQDRGLEQQLEESLVRRGRHR